LSIRQDTLVAATQGRGFWVLDDLFMVQTAATDLTDGNVHIFAPETTVNMRGRGWSIGEFEAANPEPGVPLYYYLPEKYEGPVSIEILDQDGKVIRNYLSEESDFERCLKHNEDPRTPYEPKYPSAKPGLNKWNWDTRRNGFNCVRDMTLYAGLEGPGAAPGNYTARFSGGNEIREAGFTLAMDPRITASPAEIQEWTARLDETAQLLDDVLTSLGELRKSRSQISSLMESYPDDASLQTSGTSALATIDQWDHQIIQPLHETLEDEDAWETMLAGQVRFVLDVIDSTGAPVTEGALSRLADLKKEWLELESQLESIRNDQIAPINAWARDNSVPHVSGN
jgi:hypothetical protein